MPALRPTSSRPRHPRPLAAWPASDEVVSALIEPGDGRDVRQVHGLPAGGRPAVHTGAHCVDWCGHRTFDNFGVAGDRLAGPQVVDATADAFMAARGSLAERPIAARQAGEAAGRDRERSAAAGAR